jgi:uncharacterized protein
MDEILSSIKKIIADEDRAKPVAPKSAPIAAAQKTNPATEPHVQQVFEDQDDDAVLELTETPEIEQVTQDLLDDNKARSLRHSFSTLQTLSDPGVAPQIVRSGETSLEGLARELLRPMLKDWLDTNLPGIVESMVEREIARITKKG